jgi:hypothetical protein
VYPQKELYFRSTSTVSSACYLLGLLFGLEMEPVHSSETSAVLNYTMSHLKIALRGLDPTHTWPFLYRETRSEPRISVLLKKLLVTQLLTKFLTCHKIRRFITVFTKACQETFLFLFRKCSSFSRSRLSFIYCVGYCAMQSGPHGVEW